MGKYIIYIVVFANAFGFLFYNKLPNAKAKSLLGMIFFSVLAEFFGQNIFDWAGVKSYIVFNTYILGIFNYYIFLLHSLLKKLSYRQISNVFFFFFNCTFIFNIIYLQNLFEEMITNCFAVGVIFILILSCLYLMELFNSNKVVHFKKSIYFWIVLGILLFHIPYLPMMVAIKLFTKVNVDTLYGIMLFVLNLLMYSCYCIGFIWSKKKYNY